MGIEIRGLVKSFPLRNGEELLALDGVEFDAPEDSFTCLLGPSGCGKTTVLRILAGLDTATQGICRVDDHTDSDTAPGVTMVFQDYSRSLFPWYSVRGQLAIACRARGLHPEHASKLIASVLDLTELKPYAQMLPRQLSGGMQQRVALARALVMEARTLLMDEPFGSLDALTRYQLEDHLLRLWRQRPSTILFVTHDVDEALYLADRVVVLSQRPATVISVIDTPFPRPRSHAVTRSLPEFGRLRRTIWRDLHREE